MRRAVVSHGRVSLRTASLPCAHKISLLGSKQLLAFHPGIKSRALPPECVSVDDQTRASELHGLSNKKLWLHYEGSYPGLMRTYELIASRSAVRGLKMAKLKATYDVAIEPGHDDIAELWDQTRDEKEEKSERLNRLHVEVDRRGVCTSVTDFPATTSLVRLMQNPDVPADVSGALIPYHVIRAMRAADEWEKKGVAVAALGGATLHPQFGVFPPTRQDYIDLLDKHLPALVASLPSPLIVEDLGSGSGVLSFLLAKHGAAEVRGYDISQAAVYSATADAKRLNLANKVAFHNVNLVNGLPPALASAPPPHLMVCNPPWLPDEPSSTLDAAIYDHDSIMLRSILLHARRRLRPDGKLLLIYSDLAVHLGLAEQTFIAVSASQAGFAILEKHRLPPNTALADAVAEKDRDDSDDLFKKIRQQERVSLYVLARKPSAKSPPAAPSGQPAKPR